MSLINFLLLLMVTTIRLLPSALFKVAAEVVPTSHLARKEGCPRKCGNVTIPYPFGIGKGCYYRDSEEDDIYYQIICEHKHGVARPMIGNMELLDISLTQGELRIANFVSHTCYFKNGTQITQNSPTLDNGKFTISTTKNVFAATGCDTYAWFEGRRHERSYHTGCMTVCDSKNDVTNNACTGLGCCQTPVPSGVNNISIQVSSFDNHTGVNDFNPCGSAFVVARDSFKFSLANLTRVPRKIQVLPIVLDWMVGIDNCSIAKANGNYLCKKNSICDDSNLDVGYRCKCLPGYWGNPYFRRGCKDVDECANEYLNECEKQEYCFNTLGSHYCKCPKGFHGNGTKTDHCVPFEKKTLLTGYKIAIGVGGAILISIMLGSWLYWQHEKSQLRKARKTFFQQNGGHLLRQKLKGRDVSVDVVKLFTVEELEKATNKYNDNNIVGKGGFGVVYKGILPNKQIVAIKKSLKVDANQSEQFINEVIVLSQLNNRHVVQLLGCCLETEVPLLVYEFINNGTLYDHLSDEDKAYLLTWEHRLRIALEIAEVLSYLHTTISIPIIHRDMKSMNILLDKNYTAKVSDFGASRLVPMDQDNLATMVLGTYGYLDPEYLQTGELTQKSDVYSFGVVLVELLTRQKAISNERQDNEKCLAIFFLRKLNEERLQDILDEKLVVTDELMDQIKEVAKLGQWCLKLKGEERPSMKEVATELQRIKGMMVGSHPWCRSDTILQEESAQLLGAPVLVDIDHDNKDKNMDSFDSALISLEYGR